MGRGSLCTASAVVRKSFFSQSRSHSTLVQSLPATPRHSISTPSPLLAHPATAPSPATGTWLLHVQGRQGGKGGLSAGGARRGCGGAVIPPRQVRLLVCVCVCSAMLEVACGCVDWVHGTAASQHTVTACWCGCGRGCGCASAVRCCLGGCLTRASACSIAPAPVHAPECFCRVCVTIQHTSCVFGKVPGWLFQTTGYLSAVQQPPTHCSPQVCAEPAASGRHPAHGHSAAGLRAAAGQRWVAGPGAPCE